MIKTINDLINERKAKLNKSQFCTWLSSEDMNQEDRFAFVPSQAFLVMSFKDMLDLIKIKNPVSKYDHLVNEHCLEDKDHWKWYLHDLKCLGFDMDTWGNSANDVLSQLWSDDTFLVRDVVYTSIHYIKLSKSPIYSLVIIEILEAVFAVFAKHMEQRVRREEMFEQLEYYGRTHVEKEQSHNLWEEDEIKYDTLLNSHELTNCKDAIDSIFSMFDNIFDNWYDDRNTRFKYNRDKTKLFNTKNTDLT
ncbi:MAG: hypothetical protein HOO06_10150 [Bdellovibrionaceae bacterium]|nr:hypothetical protein [Pseudobdellovibrionaceae bacterium]